MRRNVIQPIDRGKRRRWRDALSDDAGVAAVEFALVATPFIMLVLVALQTAILFFFDQALQSGTQEAARLIMTGQVASYSQANYQAAVCARLPSMFNCNNVWVDVQSAGTFSGLNTAPISPATYDPKTGKLTAPPPLLYSQGGPGDVVILRVMYDWPVVGGPFGYANQPNGTHLMVGTAVFKNEPYNGTDGLSS